MLFCDYLESLEDVLCYKGSCTNSEDFPLSIYKTLSTTGALAEVYLF